MTTTPESWEQQLHDAANAIPDSLRNRLYAESWSDGTGRRAVDLDRAADIAHAEVERLTAERAALWHLLRKQTRRMRTWRRRANEAIADAVEDAGRYMQRARQLRRELDEARAEVERLREPASVALDAVLDDIDPRLLDVIRDLGGTYGSLGVALAAATLTDTDVLVHQLTHDAPEPHDEPAPATDKDVLTPVGGDKTGSMSPCDSCPWPDAPCPCHGPAREDTPAPACTDMGCTRIGGRCVGYHCPHCGQPTGMAGHRCRPADTGKETDR